METRTMAHDGTVNNAYALVTSMDKKYFLHCGKLMISSFEKKWKNVDLDMNNQLLELISDPRYLSVHFGVKHTMDDNTYFSCETGFFMLNTHHSLYKEFCETYKSIYVNDDNKNLRRFYDGEVYGETVLRMQDKGADMLDLNKGHVHKTPIPRSILAPYIRHYKAGAKDDADFEGKIKEENNNDLLE